jgi:riboflavin kinase/FMN adenylyltransferase
MLVEKELAEFSPKKDTVLTIGVFDGVHLGHKYLISQLKEQARQRNLLSGVVTFRQHPQEVLSPQAGLLYLTNLEEKVSLLRDEGIDIVVALTFDQELAKLSARQFVALLKKYLRMVGLVIGPDFALGRGRRGDAESLRKLGEETGFTVTVVAPVKVNGEVVSSTAIRQALAKGDMAKVVRLIGRPFSLQGTVTSGVGRGSQLGFPTANQEVDIRRAIPADGVYVTWAHIDGQAYQSMTNIGLRPTFGGPGRTIETYILDYRDDLYGRELKIDIIERLRAEKRFANAGELKRQIAEDIKQGRAILEARGKN